MSEHEELLELEQKIVKICRDNNIGDELVRYMFLVEREAYTKGRKSINQKGD